MEGAAGTPRRIVSLVPSLTEALFAFGAGEHVVGCTRYCTHPAGETKRLAKVGGTRKFSVERVLDLAPDLVVAVREENDRGQVEALREAGVPVLVGAPATVEGAISFMRELAEAAGAPEAEPLLAAAECALSEGWGGAARRVFAPIWRRPYMTVGGDTYAADVLRLCGGENVFGGRERYPEVTAEEIEAAVPEVVLLPDEPYPFGAAELAEFYRMDTPASREGRVYLVDGKLLTWYGPRMASSLRQLRALLAC